MTGPCACLSLPCFTIFLLGFRMQPRRSVTTWSALRWSSCLPVSNKIEFSYLNWNLMVPKIAPAYFGLRWQFS
jgi:hypothetical protein